MKCILDGVLTDISDAMIPVNDLTLRRGYGLFDFFRVHDGIPLYPEDHIGRVNNGMARLGLSLKAGLAPIHAQITNLIASNQVQGISGIRIVISGGSPTDGFSPETGRCIITQESFSPPSASLYDEGTTLMTYEHRRELSDVKSVNYLMAVYLAPEMKRRGATEVLYHMNGKVSECTRSNVFCVKDGALHTPVTGVLPGVTRRKIIQLAREIMEVREEDFSMDFLRNAEEVFISSTIKRILPVSRIDKTGFGKPGPVSRRLMAMLEDNDRNFLSKFGI